MYAEIFRDRNFKDISLVYTVDMEIGEGSLILKERVNMEQKKRVLEIY